MLKYGQAAPHAQESQPRKTPGEPACSPRQALEGPYVSRLILEFRPEVGKQLVPSKQFLFDLSLFDPNHVIADIDEIRRYNPQRHEMEQLTAIVYMETSDPYRCAGYKDTSERDFWVRGHMPGMPLMPGVVMLEAVAQMCSFVTQRLDLLGTEMVGFGGLEDVRFRDPVLPGDRLLLIGEMIRLRRGRMIICQFQGIVGENIVVEGIVKGVPIPVELIKKLQTAKSSST